MASSSSFSSSLQVVLLLVLLVVGRVEANWCVVRSNIGQKQLQLALDYACSAGADCAPIQSSGLCFLPNTLEAHASYAFNSYFQRRSNAPGSCDFSGSATIATTDPSYGSCVYPPSPSSAGGGPNAPFIPTPTTPGTNVPNSPPLQPLTPGIGFTPGFGPPTDSSGWQLHSRTSILCSWFFVSYLLLF